MNESSRFKQIIFIICNQSGNDYIPQEPKNLRFAPNIFFLFCIFKRHNS